MKSTLRYNTEANRLLSADRPAHDWYRFVLSYPAHLVRDYLTRFGVKPGSTDSLVLDPFCGTGTTLVEAKKLGLDAIGVEANPMAAFASTVKTDWNVDPDRLLHECQIIAHRAAEELGDLNLGELNPHEVVLRSLNDEQWQVLSRDFISAMPLHKTLVLLEHILAAPCPDLLPWQRLAIAKSLVTDTGNVRFGPEIGVGKRKIDAPVVESWLNNCRIIAEDIRLLNAHRVRPGEVEVHHGDSREFLGGSIPQQSVTAVITSPPYPNEKDYTRTTRLESVLLGFVANSRELRAMKEHLLRSNTRNVFAADRDHEQVQEIPEIVEIAEQIETRRVELGKTSGFEKLYHKVTLHYFGGMRRHLAEMRNVLRPGARCAYVVGDQASYFQVLIRTGKLLGRVAEQLGYEVENIDLFRTRAATATRQQLREEVVVLRWPS